MTYKALLLKMIAVCFKNGENENFIDDLFIWKKDKTFYISVSMLGYGYRLKRINDDLDFNEDPECDSQEYVDIYYKSVKPVLLKIIFESSIIKKEEVKKKVVKI